MCCLWIFVETRKVNWRVYTMEENIFDKIKSVVRKPEPKPVKVTKISDIKATTGKISKTFTIDDENKKK